MIVLTGGAGFIGSCFLWKLNTQGITDVVIVDDIRDAGKLKNLAGKRYLDYIHKEKFLRLIEGRNFSKAGHIVHMGACSSTLIVDPDYLLENNYGYSRRLAQWAFEQKIPFLYASSAATYGDGRFGYDDADDNTLRLKPLNMYGWSKQMFDLWVLKNGHGDKTAGLKFFNVFGPNEYHKGQMCSTICKNFSEVMQGLPMKLFKSHKPDYGDGGQKRDFIYVKDVVEVMNYFFTHPGKTGIFNLGTGVARSWNDLARAVFSSVGKAACIEYIDMPEAIRSRYQYFTEAKMDKLKKAGCRYEFSTLEAAVKDYTGYLKENAYL